MNTESTVESAIKALKLAGATLNEHRREQAIEDAVVAIIEVRDATLGEDFMPTKTRRALVYVALGLFDAAINVLR